MPKKDTFHEIVIAALLKEGWEVINDPLFIPTEGGVNFFIDLGLSKIIGATKSGEKIAVEIKSFDSSSPIYSFYEILGQFLVYKLAMEEQLKPWKLYVAISQQGFNKLDDAPVIMRASKKYGIKFIIFDPVTETVVKWKK